jgi:hypothetical protein
LASGRPRGLRRGGSGRNARGGDRMTLLLRRRPREVYRVFTEEEYLNGAGSGLAGIGDEWSFGESAVADEWPLVDSPLVDLPVDEWPLPVEPVGQEVVGEGQLRRRATGEHRLHRMAGVAMLAGSVITVGGVVFLNVAWGHGRGVPRRGSFVAATHSRVARSPAVDDAQPQVALRPVVERSVEIAHSRVPPSGRSHDGPVTHRSKRSLTLRPVRRRADVAVVADHVLHPSSGEASTAPATVVPAVPPAQVSTTTTSVAPAPAPPRPAPENRAEFGFER